MMWLKYPDPIQYFPYFGVSKDTVIYINEDGLHFRAFLLEFTNEQHNVHAYQVVVYKRVDNPYDYIFQTLAFASKERALKDFHEHFEMK